MNTDYIPVSAVGLHNAPWLEDICTCPKCKGKGEWYVLWDDDGNPMELSPEQYNALSDDLRQYCDKEYCPLCDGAGEIDKRFIKNF